MNIYRLEDQAGKAELAYFDQQVNEVVEDLLPQLTKDQMHRIEDAIRVIELEDGKFAEAF